MSDFPNDSAPDFPAFSEAPQQDLVRKRVEANAKSVARSRRIRWALRITILVCGAIIAFSIFVAPENHWISGLACICFFVAMVSAVILFSMGGLAPGSTRRLLSEKERRRLDD